MLVVFEMYLEPSIDPSSILSAETLQETQAQLMTLAEAEAVGFSGLRPDPHPGEVRLLAVAQRDRRFIEQKLEMSRGVRSYKVHEVPG